MSSSSRPHWPPRRPSKRGKLRNGTVVIPSTGERTHRQFTLRASSDGPTDAEDANGYGSLPPPETMGERVQILQHKLKTSLFGFWGFLRSPAGKGVLKCTIAYLLGSLATYLSPVSNFLGKPDGKHVVATITVYFHANRTWGSMVEAILLAICAILYAQIISMLAMGLSIMGAEVGLRALSHILVVLLCIGFGLGLLSWVKAKMNNPLVNVACTLASIAIISVVTKEEAVHNGFLSSVKVVQILKILVMGVSCAFFTNLVLWRTSARENLRGSMGTAATSLGDMLAMITRCFLNGSEEELLSGHYTLTMKQYKAAWGKMTKSLKDAKIEHYVLGRENIYHMDREVIRSLEVLSQSMGGLRSAAETQFALLNELPQDLAAGQLSPGGRVWSPTLTRQLSNQMKTGPTHFGSLGAISEEQETSLGEPLEAVRPQVPIFRGPSEIFELFIARLGPSMKSLAYTLSEILRDPVFGPAPRHEITINEHFSQSLKDALNIYDETRTTALQELYQNIELGRSRTEQIQADIEEVAASCGHFSFSLQNVAEDIDAYLTVLEDLKYARKTRGRSWKWAKFWERWTEKPDAKPNPEDPDQEALLQPPEQPVRPIRKSDMPRGIPEEMRVRRDTFSWDAAPNASAIIRSISQWCLKALRFLAREDIRFGIKVGIGAMLWGMMAFIPQTRPTYKHWRGEWGLLSFMIVTSMTVGAANTTGTARSLGTLFGGVFALLFWAISNGSGIVLAFCGWLVSFGSFYVMLVIGNAPLGRTTLLAWNVTVLYAYSVSQGVDEDDDDEGGVNPIMWEIVYHRLVSVNLGILWGIFICRAIWPMSARRKFKEGLSVLYLQLGLIWRRGPLAILLRSDNTKSYLKAGEEKALQRYAFKLDALRVSASSEFELRGPFPNAAYGRIMESSQKILDGFHAMRLVTTKHGNLSPGERALLNHTAEERSQLCDRICHVFQVLASSMMLEYPLSDAIPSVTGNKDRLLGRIYQFRKAHQPEGLQGPAPTIVGSLGGQTSEARSEGAHDNSAIQAAGAEGEQGASEPANGRGKAKQKAPPSPLWTAQSPGELQQRLQDHVEAEERDYALLYAYTLVTAQVAKELQVVQKEIEGLFGVLDKESLLLQ